MENRNLHNLSLQNKIPRVCAIHDLSSFGRCALTVVIPALSALGIQTIPLPTALMSTHTGGYTDIYMRELSSDMQAMYRHWKSLGVHFDAIYSGFVLDAAQGHIIDEVISEFGSSDTLVLVDPVMGDGGQLYSTCTDDMKDTMRRLCTRADVITPNLTEACLLCGVPFPAHPIESKAQAEEICSRLLAELLTLAPRVAITGVEYKDGEHEYVLTAAATRESAHSFHPQKKIGSHYPGTGELFASVMLGLLLRGEDFESACEFSGRFVADSITLSEKYGDEKRFGTALEPALMKLAHDIYEKTQK